MLSILFGRAGCGFCLMVAVSLASASIHAATFVVTNEAQLAQAIEDANAAPSDDIILIDTPDGVNTIITLTAPLPEIAGNLVLEGEGEDAVRISGDGLFRVFFVRSGDVTFRDMTIGDGVSIGFNGGDSSGAGGGGSAGVGGGLYIRDGRTFLERVTVDNCHVVGGNGGVITAAGNGGGGGAGIDGDGEPSAANVGGDGGNGGILEGNPGTGGLEANGTDNPNGTAGGLGAGGGGGGGATGARIGGSGGAGGYLAGGGGGGAGTLTTRSGHGGTGGFGAGGGGAGLNLGGGTGNAGAAGQSGGAGGRSLDGFANGGGGGAGLGGALFVDSTGTAVTTNVTFSNNTATGGAGGVGADAGETEDDGGDGLGKGGAVYITPGSILAFEGVLLFENNSASDDLDLPGDNDDVSGAVVPLNDTGGGGSGGCFIATAAFGTPLASEIEVLRQFRDTYMMDSALGMFFVDTYYQLSPPFANAIAAHPELAALTRLGLTPALWIISAFMSPEGQLLLGAVLITLVAGLHRRLLKRPAHQ